MPRYNPQWEDRIKGYRKNRLLLVARNLPFNAPPTAVEAAIRARLTKPDSFIFLWPPGASSPERHQGWVMMGFNMRPDARMAEEELKDFEILGRPVRVERASRQAVTEVRRAVAAAALVSAEANAGVTPAPPPPPPPNTTTAATTTTTTPATVATSLPLRPGPIHDTAARNSPDSLKETPMLSQDVGEWENDCHMDDDEISDTAEVTKFEDDDE
ncbi:hypothetical protein M441DRAFT_138468 [Trichoderma asperellum CBS 433.97]|uniref:RRM domain-containing protein n=1 Tax=Trichoderma asperellum (strain ATCC 204424 / CBS 433.97 / NBRC 101777) TaxID=1042311 RepID=A0A2T3ZAG7_TRIA4|nr:hypothetical protein M441DRAFT_138468 [Trichoderma asperellum CBS 433.97]PTB41770.1 hypothetical protein M441DRAFT_138468 [Trichoderma asperellum CBS 433.97]